MIHIELPHLFLGLIVLISATSAYVAPKVLPKKPILLSPSRLSMSSAGWEQGQYLERMVQKKKFEVDALLRRHQDIDDPLVMRMGYVASEGKYEITTSLKRDACGEEGLHTMSVLCDLKRRSPTVPTRRNVIEFESASKFAKILTLATVDGFLVNTDDVDYVAMSELSRAVSLYYKYCTTPRGLHTKCSISRMIIMNVHHNHHSHNALQIYITRHHRYGGSFLELKETVQATRLAKPDQPPACICKDIIIHPVQIAQALEQGASGVLLIMAVVGGDLETLLDACTIMGTEAIVEVHSPEELEFALGKGATLFLVNMWDRTTGILHKDQAKGLATMMPVNAVAIAAGGIGTIEEAAELAFYGYDSVVLGRAMADMPDIKDFIDGVKGVRGPPRSMTSGMKGPIW